MAETLIVWTCIVVVILFGIGAVIASLTGTWAQRLEKSADASVESSVQPAEDTHLLHTPSTTLEFAQDYNSTEFFLTARNSQSTFRIGWGLYASIIGASVIFAPSSIVADPDWGAGYIGLLSYSFFSGFPLVVAAYVGHRIRLVCPAATSIGSFARWRYGQSFEYYISFQVLFNVGIALAAEYTAVGDLFGVILKTSRIWPVMIIGFVTMVYTVVGGLYISILTDQYQSSFSLILLVIVTIYLSIFFRLETPLPPLPPYLAANNMGFASIFTLGVSLLSSTLMSDAVWQRIWAAQDERALKRGSWMACSLATLVTAYFGAAGFLATWMGISKDPSTAFFSLIQYVSSGKQSMAGDTVTSGTSTWILTLVCVVVVTMNESAVDSFQSALADTILSLGLANGQKLPVLYARIAVVVINIPLVIIGSQGYPIASLYLITNIFTSCSFIPLIMGLIPSLDYIVTGPSALFGSIFGIICVAGHGWYSLGDLSKGLQHHFFDARYDWPSFVFGISGSVIGVFAYAFLEIAWYALILRQPVPLPKHLDTDEHILERHNILGGSGPIPITRSFSSESSSSISSELVSQTLYG